ncbi:MAG: hypothetical protein HYW05_00565 [Candidatus Diapherotrites archaeon]|nr:hypothetical protein [Candidatus Diapherotrites archaeon]
MPKLDLIPEQQLKKHALVFCMDNILIPGDIAQKINKGAIEEILQNLHEMETRYKNFHVFVVSGAKTEEAKGIISENGLNSYFNDANILGVTQAYVDSKEPIDKERYGIELQKNPRFRDEFFKQYAIDKEIIEKRGIPRENILLICHDLLTDAFYTLRFSQVDFALVKGALSYRHLPIKEVIKGLVYLNMNWKEFRKLLTGKSKKGNTKFLESYVYSRLQKDVIGGFEIDVKTIELKKKKKTENKMQRAALDSAQAVKEKTGGKADF